MFRLIYRRNIAAMGWVLFAFICFSTNVFGQMYPVARESSLNFTIRNFGFKVSGKFAPPEGEIRFNPDSLAAAYFHITVKSTTINTDNESRDNHLRESDYFDVTAYPLMKFVSVSIRSVNKSNEFEVSGKLTIKNKTEQITIPFKAEKAGQAYVFTGNFKIKRKDFDVGGTSTLSDEVSIDLKVVAQ
jgi:polyisoprenoid-binding protein YceI